MPINNAVALTGNAPGSTAALSDDFAGDDADRRERASAPILAALRQAGETFREWDAQCAQIDNIYSQWGRSYEELMAMSAGFGDNKLDLFWSSFEILKPAVYARPPKPAVKPLFSDGGKLKTLTAELLERAAVSAFARTNIDDAMTEIRDDLIFTGRGVMWLRYESDDGQKVCVEHLDRADFLHEPARKWSEVGWVAGGFWLTRDELAKRFGKLTEDQLDNAKFTRRRDDDDRDNALAQKAHVWEVWHRADNKVYWVTEGIDTLLEASTPHLKLSGFFPCPRPAYATLRRRSLVPVPDYERYATHFAKISQLTARIYLLLDSVKMKGLIPAGGDVGDSVEQLIASDDDKMLIPVPGAALMAQGGVANFVQWLPLVEIATAIQGLIEARGQLIEDFYQLSGISDIMRGATQAEETLGAQQLKSQFGSVRVRGKIDELQRVAADAVKIAAEIIAEKFTKETLLEMAQMDVPTKRELSDRVKEVEEAAEKELKAFGKQAEEAATMAQEQAQQGGEALDPAQAQQMLQQAQQALIGKYGAMLAEVEGMVPIDDVIELLRDDKARGFAFEIESDSTILTDEMAEKQSRSEFMGAFTQAQAGLMGLAAMGEPGAQLAGELMKFTLAPYRAGRQLDSAIDAFIEAAPEMAAQAAGQQDDGGMAGLAEAEKMKAQAAMERVQAQREADQARAARDQAEMQRKMGELQVKAQADQQKAAEAMEKLRQSGAEAEGKLAKTEAEIDHLRAQTAEILNKIGLDVREQELSEYQAAETSQARAVDQQRTAENDQVDRQFRERGENRADMAVEREPSE